MSLIDRATVYAALGDPHRLQIVDALALNDLTPHEIASLTGLESNLAAHHLAVLEEAGIIERQISAGDKRRRYVVLRRARLQNLEPTRPMTARSVLFVCTHNSARSQFAEAAFRERLGLSVQSAGTDPAEAIHPKAFRVAEEQGLDLNSQFPKPYRAVRGEPDLIVSVCDRACESSIPFAGDRLHWSIPDPVESGRIAGFRKAASEIIERVEQLSRALSPERESGGD